MSGVMRDARAFALHRMLLLIEEWRHASDGDRDVARHEARAAIVYFRTYFEAPERRAFAAAVARNNSRRTAA